MASWPAQESRQTNVGPNPQDIGETADAQRLSSSSGSGPPMPRAPKASVCKRLRSCSEAS